MGWLGDNGWFVWTVAAVLLAVGEIFSIDLVMGMLAIAALVGVIVDLLGGGWVVQVIAVSVAAVGLLAFVRPPIVRRLHAGPDVRSGTAGLPGKPGYVEEDVSVEGGRVRIGGEVWSAQPSVEGDVIPAGSRVEVVEIRGATAVVRPARLES
jgi:membrane protein implicated in regulation of membrane protease activity